MRQLNNKGVIGGAVLAVLVILVFLGAILAVAYINSPERPMYDVPEGKECIKWAQGKGTWTAIAPSGLIAQAIGGAVEVKLVVADRAPSRSLSLPTGIFGVGEIDGEVWISQTVTGPSGPVVANWESAHEDVHWDIIGTAITKDFTGGAACLYDAGTWIFDFDLHFDGTGGARVFHSVRQTVVV